MRSAASAPHTSGLAWYKGGETSALYPVFFLAFLCTVQSVQIKSVPPGQKWPGFSFALHLLKVQGFCFALLQYSPHTNVYSAFCAVNATIPHTAQNSAQGFTGAFPAIRLFCRRCVAGASAYTAPAAPRWSVSQRRNTSSTYQIPAPHRTLYSSAQTAYYNNVYKGARVRRLLWIHARQCSRSQTIPT